MSEFPYKNPISPQTVNGPISVQRTDDFGSNFSNLSVGGHMEVYNLSDLIYTIPSGTTGQINYSGNTIPITFIKGTGASYSPDVLTLYSDNISSGRRKLGMLVYVYETDLTYEFYIKNYNTLWNSATGATGVGGNTVVISEFGTQVKGNTPQGVAFISGWTGSTIEGVNGVTRETANWRIFNLNGIYLTGGTYFSGTSELDLYNNDGSVITVTGITSGGGGVPINVSISANTGLGEINNQLFTTYNTTLNSALSTTTTIGGFPSGTTVNQLSGRSFVSLFDDLLFPTVSATYTIPTINVNSPGSSTVEVGSTYNTTIQIRAVKNDAGNFTLIGFRRNGVTVSSTTVLIASTTTATPFIGPSNPNAPNSAFTVNFSQSYIIPTGLTTSTTTYDGIGNYLSGLPKFNNKGLIDDRTPSIRTTTAPQLSANTFPSSTITITGIYPYFYGTSLSNNQITVDMVRTVISGGTVAGVTNNKVLQAITNTTTINYNSDDTAKYYWFAHNSSYPIKIQWYKNSIDQASINPFPNTSGFFTVYSATTNSESGFWSGKTYYIYLSNNAQTLGSINFNAVTVV
jgi:hypothetical protein